MEAVDVDVAGATGFAELLLELKDRSGRSYEALARRAGVSSSALHRYCSGRAVPPTLDVVERLGRTCGASREEILELHRRWVVATAVRNGTLPVGPRLEPSEPDGLASMDPAAALVPVGAPPAPGRARPATRLRFRRTLRASRAPSWWILAAVVVTVAAVLTLSGSQVITGRHQPAVTTTPFRGGLLYAPQCAGTLMVGRHDECVGEVQDRLEQAGAVLTSTGEFDAMTLSRLIAFQALAGLTPTGVVDEPTKQKLYDSAVTMPTWTRKQITDTIWHGFPDVEAVEIAICRSSLDPMYVLPVTSGSRTWGAFGIPDEELRRNHWTPKEALGLEANIKMARWLWGHGKRSQWSMECDSSTTRHKTPTPS
jgi:transcriptional regulator with XRE-family HTH domain